VQSEDKEEKQQVAGRSNNEIRIGVIFSHSQRQEENRRHLGTEAEFNFAELT
jgi:hypothetical protein